MALPDQIGVLGGYPGSVCSYALKRKTDWKSYLAQHGRVPSQDDLGGERQPLDAKTSLQLFPGDVVNMVVQNGGGYGDPLFREPARVECDVLDGAVTVGTARTVYGVVLDANGAVDEAATRAARDEIRKMRKSGSVMPAKAVHSEAVAHVHPLAWGQTLTVKHGPGLLSLQCGHCGESLGTTKDDWRSAASIRCPSASELGPHVRLDDRFVFEQAICPHCSASLWVDTRKRDEARAVDFTLA